MSIDPLPPESDTFVTTSEACRLLGVSKRTVLNWLDQGVLVAWSTVGGHHRIPLRMIEEMLKKRREELQGGGNSLTLLWVEDDAELVEVYREVVANWVLPVRLVTADNGFDGLLQAGFCKPEVIIADLSMPAMDGFEMIRSLRQWPELQKSLILVVTALTPGEIAARGTLPVEVPVLHKPTPFKRIRALIEEKLDRGRPGQRLLSAFPMPRE